MPNGSPPIPNEPAPSEILLLNGEPIAFMAGFIPALAGIAPMLARLAPAGCCIYGFDSMLGCAIGCLVAAKKPKRANVKAYEEELSEEVAETWLHLPSACLRDPTS